jgi:hypothetical protein
MAHEIVRRVSRTAAPAFLSERTIDNRNELLAAIDAPVGKLVRPQRQYVLGDVNAAGP